MDRNKLKEVGRRRRWSHARWWRRQSANFFKQRARASRSGHTEQRGGAGAPITTAPRKTTADARRSPGSQCGCVCVKEVVLTPSLHMVANAG